MSTFRVVWEIDINADDAEQAARIAFAIQRDPLSIASVFTVKSEDGTSVDIDLEDFQEPKSVLIEEDEMW